MPVELIFIVGSVCGAVVGMAVSGKFKNRGVRITPFVAAVSGWLWLFIELLKSL